MGNRTSDNEFFHREHKGQILKGRNVFPQFMVDGSVDRKNAEPLLVNGYNNVQLVVYKVYPIDFSNTTEIEIDFKCNFALMTYATIAGGVTPVLYIRFGDKLNDRVRFTAGLGLRGLECDRIFISGSGVAETGELFLAYDPNIYAIEST